MACSFLFFLILCIICFFKFYLAFWPCIVSQWNFLDIYILGLLDYQVQWSMFHCWHSMDFLHDHTISHKLKNIDLCAQFLSCSLFLASHLRILEEISLLDFYLVFLGFKKQFMNWSNCYWWCAVFFSTWISL